VEPALAYHVTQRGVNRERVFFTIADRKLYLELLRSQLAVTRVKVLAYCVMGNHVHSVVVPGVADALGTLFRRVHGGYAQYCNVRRGEPGTCGSSDSSRARCRRSTFGAAYAM
jgi:REP element-mobilizing transposase RayT